MTLSSEAPGSLDRGPLMLPMLRQILNTSPLEYRHGGSSPWKLAIFRDPLGGGETDVRTLGALPALAEDLSSWPPTPKMSASQKVLEEVPLYNLQSCQSLDLLCEAA